MKTLLNLLLKTKRQQRRHPPKSTGGFTMIELLVGMIIAFLIIVPMLAFVVDILNRDVQEQVKASAEQDIQAAIDYITQDMSQAVYVYTADQVDAIEELADRPIPTPTVEAGGEQQAVLVFWKRDYQENVLPADSSVTVDEAAGYCEDARANDEDADNLCDDYFAMSLVAYYLITDGNDTWCQSGDICSRIARAEISDGTKYQGVYINTEAVDADSPGKGFNPENIGNRTEVAELSKGDGDFDPVQVLVNHIQGFELERVGTNQKLATIKLVGNALARNESGATCIESTDPIKYKKSAYCPIVTVQVGGRSGFGSSE
jgi:type II secretory pathway pseudopilin PulG